MYLKSYLSVVTHTFTHIIFDNRFIGEKYKNEITIDKINLYF